MTLNKVEGPEKINSGLELSNLQKKRTALQIKKIDTEGPFVQLQKRCSGV